MKSIQLRLFQSVVKLIFIHALAGSDCFYRSFGKWSEFSFFFTECKKMKMSQTPPSYYNLISNLAALTLNVDLDLTSHKSVGLR